jgi:hypothetical protein
MKIQEYLVEMDRAIRLIVVEVHREHIEAERLRTELNLLKRATSDGYERASWLALNPDLDDEGLGTMMRSETYFGADKDRFHKQAELVEAELRFSSHEFSTSALAGTLLQFAKHGLSLCLGKARHHGPDGRLVAGMPLHEVVWQARNQALHWEDGKFHEATDKCFQSLAKENGVFGQYKDRSRPLTSLRCSDGIHTKKATGATAAGIARARHPAGTGQAVGYAGSIMARTCTRIPARVLGLSKADLDLQIPGIWIRRSQARKIVSTPKNKRARFQVIPRALADELQRFMLRTEDQLLFPDPRGGVLSNKILNRWFRDVAREAGVRRITSHGARHTAGSNYAVMGAGQKVIGTLLGHSDSASTERYTHVAPSATTAMVEARWLRLGGGEGGR